MTSYSRSMVTLTLCYVACSVSVTVWYSW